ncbi:P-type ATPase [Plastoroseomonas arctica]|uniref:P-type ATPase n=1 Tax=Plastoroseomonas arctica TaxID=1509237 RepID=UPI003462174E
MADTPSRFVIAPAELWREPAERLLTRLDSAPHGLSAAEARLRLQHCGPNDTGTEKRAPAWLQFLRRFSNPLIIILLVASGLSALTGDIASFVIITMIVVASMGLDFVQEMRAQNAVDVLRRSVAVQALVRRDGMAVSVAMAALMPGDVVELIAGDLVPADARLLDSRDLFINQALLTGEPYPAAKQAGDQAADTDTPAGASNCVFAGTSVISGKATILLCRTGADTALGALVKSLAEKPPATAFATGIHRFSMLILRFTMFMVLFVLVVNIALERPVVDRCSTR